MSYHHLFDAQSDIYARARPLYPPTLYNFLVSVCSEHQMAWDCACGNGQVAVDLINHFTQVQATDVSEQQIANAIQKDGITYDVIPAEATSFADNTFDLICVGQALHWFDYDKFWPEIKRVLKLNGIFAAWGYSFFTIAEQIDQIIDTTFLDTIYPYWPDRNRLLWDHYLDVSFPLEKITPPPISLVMEWSVDELFAYLRSWSSTQRCVDAIGDDFFIKAYEQTREIWGEPNMKRVINMDFCLVVGRN